MRPRYVDNRLDIYSLWKTVRKSFKASNIFYTKRDKLNLKLEIRRVTVPINVPLSQFVYY